jgi:hypothetical protein
MKFKWQSEAQKIEKGTKMSTAKKLEGIRLMNELADKVLTGLQKASRRKLREKGV